MRSAIDPSDRKLLLIAGAVMLVLAAALAIVSPPPAEQGGGIPSIYSDASGGAHAAFLLLQKLHRHLHAWERPPMDLPQDSENAILILANPDEAPSSAEKEALLQFAETGGRIIFTGPRVGDFFPNAELLGRTSRETMGHVSSQSSEQLHAPGRDNYFAEAE